MYEQPDVYDQLQRIHNETDIGGLEEHALGRVYDGVGGNTVTPMLVYHDSQFDPANTCDSDADTGTVYSAHPTSCTVQAMEYMANDSDCNRQSNNIC